MFVLPKGGGGRPNGGMANLTNYIGEFAIAVFRNFYHYMFILLRCIQWPCYVVTGQIQEPKDPHRPVIVEVVYTYCIHPKLDYQGRGFSF